MFEIVPYREGEHYINVKMSDKFRFSCQRCGTCCSDPGVLQPTELEGLAKYFSMERQEFFEGLCEPYVYTGMVTFKKRKGRCVFYIPGEEGTCIINEVKPGYCRTRPPLTSRFVFTSTLDDFDHPKRLSIAICAGYGKGRKKRVSRFVEETNALEHLITDHDIIMEFVELLAGIEAVAKIVYDSPAPGTDQWRKIMDFIERKYDVKII